MVGKVVKGKRTTSAADWPLRLVTERALDGINEMVRLEEHADRVVLHLGIGQQSAPPRRVDPKRRRPVPVRFVVCQKLGPPRRNQFSCSGNRVLAPHRPRRRRTHLRSPVRGEASEPNPAVVATLSPDGAPTHPPFTRRSSGRRKRLARRRARATPLRRQSRAPPALPS